MTRAVSGDQCPRHLVEWGFSSVILSLKGMPSL